MIAFVVTLKAFFLYLEELLLQLAIEEPLHLEQHVWLDAHSNYKIQYCRLLPEIFPMRTVMQQKMESSVILNLNKLCALEFVAVETLNEKHAIILSVS